MLKSSTYLFGCHATPAAGSKTPGRAGTRFCWLCRFVVIVFVVVFVVGVVVVVAVVESMMMCVAVAVSLELCPFLHSPLVVEWLRVPRCRVEDAVEGDDRDSGEGVEEAERSVGRRNGGEGEGRGQG